LAQPDNDPNEATAASSKKLLHTVFLSIDYSFQINSSARKMLNIAIGHHY
jgi:hypothetical protein